MNLVLYLVSILIIATCIISSIAIAICNKDDIKVFGLACGILFNLFLLLDAFIILISVIRIWRA